METTKRLMILSIAAVLAAGPIQAAEQSQPKLSDTRAASCLVKVTCDPAILPLNLDTVTSLLESSAVGGKAARQVLSLSPDQVPGLFTIEYEQLATSGNDATPKSSKGRSSGLKDDMDEYEYAMMMEAEYGKSIERFNSSFPKPSSSSSTLRRSRSSSRRSATSLYDDMMSGTRSGRRSTRGRTSPSDFYGDVAESPSAPIDEKTYLFSLNVQLPDEVKPAAKEFMNALVDNLRQALTDAYHAYKQELQSMLEFAESQRGHVQSQLARTTQQAEATVVVPTVKQNPANVAVYKQLEETIALPTLTPQTSFEDVIRMLENSISPPLQIQPNWKDLLEKAEVEPTTPAGMDPLNGVKARKALEILLAAVSNDFAELNYVVDEGVILIATKETLPDKMETRVYEIPALACSASAARELVNAIRQTIEPESWFDTSDTGEGTISVYLGKKLAILQTSEIHQKIQEFLVAMTINSPVGLPSEVPTEMLTSEKYNLLREKQHLELEIAKLQARPPAIEEQIKRTTAEIQEKIKEDPVSNELRNILALQTQHLEAVKKLALDGRISSAELATAEEKLARTRIELAQRREQLSKSAGGDQLVKFSNELATLTVDLAEKQAMLEVIDDQLGQTEEQLLAATISDLQVTRLRQATQILEGIDRRANELNSRIIDLQPPTVSVIGGD